jgi:hypothetical protein
MTVAELFALPVGTRLRFEAVDVAGELAGHDADGQPLIRWDDGRESVVYRCDTDLSEIADALEPEADTPAIVRAGARRDAY